MRFEWMARACITYLPVALTVRCHFLANFPRQALSPVTCCHRKSTTTPETIPPLTASAPPSSPLSSLPPPLPVPKRLPPKNTSQYHLSLLPLPCYSDTDITGTHRPPPPSTLPSPLPTLQPPSPLCSLATLKTSNIDASVPAGATSKITAFR